MPQKYIDEILVSKTKNSVHHILQDNEAFLLQQNSALFRDAALSKNVFVIKPEQEMPETMFRS